MQKFEYWIRDVLPDDAQSFLRLAGAQGWELISVIIKQKPKNLINSQYPQFEIFYSLILKRFLVSSEDVEIEEVKKDGNN